jgi:hypothetical protein
MARPILCAFAIANARHAPSLPAIGLALPISFFILTKKPQLARLERH